MQRISEIVCWAAVGILLLYGILYVLTRALASPLAYSGFSQILLCLGGYSFLPVWRY
jgi:hypothetical protein